MQSLIRTFSGFALAAAALLGATQALAQGGGFSTGASSWYAPNSTYLGFNAGKSNYSLGSGAGGFAFDKRDTGYSLYGGGYFNNHFGVELGYSNFGRISRAGGSTKAEGINLSLVGRLPLASSFSLIGKVGTTYGRTNVSSLPASGVAAGRETGFGLSYGVGAEYAITPNWSAVLQWDEHDLKFPGGNRDGVSSTSVGLKYRF